MLQAQAFPAQDVEKVCCSISSIGRQTSSQVSAVLALPLCLTLLPCSIMNHTRTWVAQTEKPS